MYVLLALVLMLLLFMPAALVVLGVGLLILLPAWLMATSVLTLVLAPQQIMAVASDRRTRRNHSCEHATVAVLEEWYGALPHVGGLATKEGFYLFGAQGFDPSIILRAAQNGLKRMAIGEHHLAWHPRCGTSLMAARVVFALAFLGLLIAAGQFTFTGIALALILSWLLGRPMGMLVQRWFTTASDVDGLQIDGMYWTDRPQIGNRVVMLPNGAYFVRVSQ